ncbi:P-II family nitrogen regulator [Anaerobium acetethylicum]|uniref:Nitrogen regulatory protein PII n=1 Tax=Anaerobium acetethylicum TaxID=1619234 RepID=A0A1D3TVP4_9FIRM|nr:P-II family nitrogen regulator [Anaerobium acetethylicum]SCP98235.1 Nitrogen regulatory protein PII [Anaerobium acetethylicum]
MKNNPGKPAFEMIYIIAEDGKASEILHSAKRHGIKGGTVFLGQGTVDSPFLRLFSICSIRKEVILMGTDAETAGSALEALNKEFGFERSGKGIAFTIPVGSIWGARCYKCEGIGRSGGADQTMYQAITVIVDKGKAEQVIEAAEKAGSNGGLILNARGSGIHETSRIFAMDIEPEKEVVMLLSENEKAEAIVESIRKDLKLDEPGTGIIFTQNVNRMYGV